MKIPGLLVELPNILSGVCFLPATVKNVPFILSFNVRDASTSWHFTGVKIRNLKHGEFNSSAEGHPFTREQCWGPTRESKSRATCVTATPHCPLITDQRGQHFSSKLNPQVPTPCLISPSSLLCGL